MNAAELRKATFALDDDDHAYEGVTTGELWNGWECPIFTRATVEQIMAQSFVADSPEIDWHFNDAGEVVIMWNGADDPDAVDTYAPLHVEGADEPLYALGAWAWCWMQV